MKRYFINYEEKQVMMVEFANNSVLSEQDVVDLFGDVKGIVEVGKTEYLRVKAQYQSENKTNMTLTISR